MAHGTPDGLAPVLTVVETARLLRIGRNKAYDLVRAGVIPSIRLGRSIRIPRDALLRWLDAGGADDPVLIGRRNAKPRAGNSGQAA